MGHAASSSSSPTNNDLSDNPEDSVVSETMAKLRECGKESVVPVESVEFGKQVKKLLFWRKKLSMTRYPELEAIEDFSEPTQAAAASSSREAKRQLDAFGASIQSDEINYETQGESCASLVASDIDALLQVVSRVRNTFAVVQLNNRFRTPHFNGYRDVFFVLLIVDMLVELQVHHKQLKLITERHGYRDGVFFRNVGCSETLQLHRYFKRFFQKGGTVETLQAVVDGDRSALELVFEQRHRDEDKAHQLDFLLEKLGELDLRSKQLLMSDDEDKGHDRLRRQPEELAQFLAHTGLSKDQAHLIEKHASTLPDEGDRVAKEKALQAESEDGILFGYLVLTFLAHAVRAEERSDGVVQPKRDNHKPSTFYYT